MMLKAIVLAVLALPLWKEDRPITPEKTRELEAVAEAVHRHAKGDRELAAMTLSIGWHESAYSSRIGRSECKKFECDPRRLRDGTLEFRARGYWQLHRNGLNDEQWAALSGPGSVDTQAKEAVRRVRSARALCKNSGWMPTFRAYAGNGCDRRLKGEESRAILTERILERI